MTTEPTITATDWARFQAYYGKGDEISGADTVAWLTECLGYSTDQAEAVAFYEGFFEAVLFAGTRVETEDGLGDASAYIGGDSSAIAYERIELTRENPELADSMRLIAYGELYRPGTETLLKSYIDDPTTERDDWFGAGFAYSLAYQEHGDSFAERDHLAAEALLDRLGREFHELSIEIPAETAEDRSTWTLIN